MGAAEKKTQAEQAKSMSDNLITLSTYTLYKLSKT